MFSGKKKNWISFYVLNVRSWLKIGSPFQNFWVLFWLGNRRLLTACGKYTIFGYWSDKELTQINATQATLCISFDNISWYLISYHFQNIVKISLSHFFGQYHTIFNHVVIGLFQTFMDLWKLNDLLNFFWSDI